METEPISVRDFFTRVYQQRNKIYTLELDGWEVPILHGLIALVARHPDMGKLGSPTHTVIGEVRSWCLEVMRGWGFTNAQLKWLDECNLSAWREVTDGRK